MATIKAKRDSIAKSKIMESELIRMKYQKRREGSQDEINNKSQRMHKNASVMSSPEKSSRVEMDTIEEEKEDGNYLLKIR
jgi:hypothetical protein